MITVLGTCSNKPRPSVQTNRLEFKTGACIWGKDPWHVKGENGKTLCGINCTEWLDMGQLEPDPHLCDRCRRKI